MQKEFIYLNKKVSYQVYGKGTPVLLLHGFPLNGDIFKKQIAFLKEHCLLVVPDLPGSRFSEYNERLDSIEEYAKCFHALMQHENIVQCIVMGHSMGGYMGLAYAKLFPESIIGLGLIHSTALADTEEKKQTRQKVIDFIEQHGGYEFLKTSTPGLFTEAFKNQHTAEIQQLIKESAATITDKALQLFYRIMIKRPDATGILKKITHPVLFIIGTEDKAAPLESLQPQIVLPPTPIVHILQETAHMSMWENSDLLNKYLLGFIQKAE
jgi:Predicted hydrolases or acyltransferases (alpha/beta hydrolase superfamily)